MKRKTHNVAIAGSLILFLGVSALNAQESNNPVNNTSVTETLRLDLETILLLAAEDNFQVRQSRERMNEATGSYKIERSKLLPKVSGILSQNRQDRSTAAFGLPESTVAAIPDPIPFDINYPGLSQNLINRFNLPTEGFTQVTEPINIEYDNSESTGPYNTFNANLRMNMALFDREKYETLDISKLNLTRGEVEIDFYRQEAMSTAAQLYYAVLVQQKSMEALQGKIDLHLDKLEEINDLLSTGVARPLDVKKEEVALASAQNSLLDATKRKAAALRELKRQLNIPIEEPVEILGDLYYQEVALIESTNTLRSALENRLDVQLQEFRERSASMQRDAAAYTRWPKVMGMGSYGRQGSAPDQTVEAWMVGVYASVPIWDSFERRGKIEVRESQYQQTRFETEDLTKAVESELALLRDELLFTTDTVNLLKTSVEYLDDNRQYLEDKVTAGTGKRIDLLSAEVDLAQAEYKLVEAIFNHEIVRIKWLKAIGAIEEVARIPDDI